MSQHFDQKGQNLSDYVVPEWFRDAKLGIFIHWGIYSVPAYGDEWYGHWMYKANSKSWAGDDIYTYNQEKHKGLGYKDFIAGFNGKCFDAREWVELFKEAGAKYIVPVAMHHDSFAMYDSKLTEWKSTTMGPRKDIMRELANEARREGMHFGLSNHFAENWWFFPHEEALDTSDPAFANLYGYGEELTEEHMNRWYDLSVEQINAFQPELLYYDFEIAKPEFREHRRKLAAYYYNKQQEWNKGVVLNYKYESYEDGEAVLDVERGQLADIREMPWQACTSISKKSWGYIDNDSFKTVEEIITNLVDIVSKNGCLLLNVGPRADGTIPSEQQEVLRQLGSWLSVNGEAIYNTRPWRVFGEGPTMVGGEALTEKENVPFSSADLRFTVSKDNRSIYVIALGSPLDKTLSISSMSEDLFDSNEIEAVQHISGSNLIWNQNSSGLHVILPNDVDLASAFALKVTLK